MLNVKSGNLTLSAMFMALGVLLPIVFHAVGMGSMFLPLFWPVAAAIFFLPGRYATMVGLLTPVLSFFLTGMPPVSPPILQLIMLELFIMTLVGGLLYRLTQLGLIWVMLLALLASRISLFLAVLPFGRILGIPPAIASTAFVLQGILGIVLIVAIIPILVNRIKGDNIWEKRS